MSRRFILSYLPGTKVCPWSRYREAFTARFDELFGGATMAAYQTLADRMHCSEDTIRRLYIGQEGDRHVFPKASVLAELERAMEMAPGSLGAQVEVIPPPQAQEVGGVQVIAAPMPLGSELEDTTSGSFPPGAFYEIALHNLQTSWSLTLLKNLPRTLMQMNTKGQFPVYCEDNGRDIRLVSPYHLPGSTSPMSQVFTGEARDKVLSLLRPIDPGKAFLVVGQVYETLVGEAKTQATEQALGEAKMDDVLAKFRSGIGDLCKLNDDLKVLQVDAEDVAADLAAKDPRVGFIAKRIKTVRSGISVLLRHTFPNQ